MDKESLAAGQPPQPAARWISRGFEELVHEHAKNPPGEPFDLVIVGSGYGGAVAAAEFAGRMVGNAHQAARVCVLERGVEYLKGMFPTNEADLPGHVRISAAGRSKPWGNREGLLDVRVGPDVCALVACGLGGGSLINAGVMATAGRDAWPEGIWPSTLPQQNLDHFYEQAKRKLGVRVGIDDNTIARNARGQPLKFKALKTLSAANFAPTSLSISMAEGPNATGIQLGACNQCGDCATGCNHEAKNSLDQNLLVEAHRRGAAIYTGATVTSLAKLPEGGWVVRVVHTDEALRQRASGPFEVRAGRVILAAGTFGSTEILLRSASSELRFSQRLGQRFSTNGDALAVAYGQGCEVNALACESDDPHPSSPTKGRTVGPTITGMIDRRGESKAPGTIEEFSIPGALRRLFAESFTLARCLDDLAEPDKSLHEPGKKGTIDPHAADEGMLRNTQVFGVMGHDGANGSLELVEPNVKDDEICDGAVRVRWPAVREDDRFKLFDDQIEVLKELVEQSGQGGKVLPNVLWRPLPAVLKGVLDVPKGPVVTVHPLGGCPMGDTVKDGVVDDIGRVFDPRSEDVGQDLGRSRDRRKREFHDRLAVLDGSIVPTSLAVNPALTITAIALRAVQLLRREWGFSDNEPQENRQAQLPLARPHFAKPAYIARRPTQVEIIERLCGPITLRDKQGRKTKRIAELTMQFAPIALGELMGPLKRTLTLGAGSCLRTFDPETWQSLTQYECSEEEFKERAAGNYELSGSLVVLDREASTRLRRLLRAGWAWLRNRGLRDTWQWIFDRRNREDVGLLEAIRKRWTLLKALATRAGEVRRFDYDLELGTATRKDAAIGAADTTRIHGYKRFTYARRGNPWVQLQELHITRFPGRAFGKPPVLELDLQFLARKNAPLFRLTEQDNQATALFDVASFLAYFTRLMISIHTWSLRKPDSQKPREPDRLPRTIPGLPEAEVVELDVGRHTDGTIARVRLTRFPRRESPHNPLIMIHGYSASGTTFVHPAVRPNLASYMWQRNRDVWILDLRTSSGMPTADLPWTFEQAAHEDIPAALGYIERLVANERQASGALRRPVQVDVIAHCMGSAMMTMAILGRPEPGVKFFAERERLPKLIDRLIISQVAPTTTFSRANVFRAYVVGFLRHLLPLGQFQFRPRHEPTPMDQLLDRLLATMPYPVEEYTIENPRRPWKKTPWVRTRHRMDALYGRDFNVKNIEPETLEYIDDLFGPLNIDTVLSAIHFARMGLITNSVGRNVYVKRSRLKEHWRGIKTLCVNGGKNGLVDVATAYRLKDLMDDAHVEVFRTLIKEDYGHQDCLIGRGAGELFEHMHRFLMDPAGFESTPDIQRPRWLPRVIDECRVGVPWLGPVRGNHVADTKMLGISVAPDPKIGTPSHFVIAAVVEQNQRYALRKMTKGRAVVPQSWEGHGFALKHLNISLAQFEPPEEDEPYDLLALFVYDEPPTDDAIDEAVREYLRTTTTKQAATGVCFQISRTPEETQQSANKVTFAIGSCQYPPGALDARPAEQSYVRLAELLASKDKQKPEFLVLMGDQIYSDATAGLFDPTVSEDRYVLPYENWLRTDSVRAVLRQLPTYMMLDDHEIENNWEPTGAGDRERSNALKLGRDAYWTYQRTMQPRAGAQPVNKLWYETTTTPAKLPFFFADSRTDRQVRTLEDIQNASMMSPEQRRSLLQWLARKHDPRLPKFVVSSSMLLPRKIQYGDSAAAAFRADTWQGYPATFHEVLAQIANECPRNLVFISGDEHHSCVARVIVRNVSANTPPAVFHSIHCSGLYSPFPFANGKPEDLIKHDSFTFKWNDDEYRCEVEVDEKLPAPGDGFATIQCVRTAEDWSVRCRFEPGRGEKDLDTSLPSHSPSPDWVTQKAEGQV